MANGNWMAKRRNYFLCRLCGKVLRMSAYDRKPHCGELPKEITDVEARSRVEGKSKGPRFSSVMSRRGADDLETAERWARYNIRFRNSRGRARLGK